MLRFALIATMLFLTACADGERSGPQVSRAGDRMVTGMTYDQFRAAGINDGADGSVVQKRFILLDRDNNGVLSANEFSE